METIYLDGEGLGVLFNKAWKRVAVRFLFNEEKKWSSGELHKRIQNHLAPRSVSPASVSNFLKDLYERGLLHGEKRKGHGFRGGGLRYWRAMDVAGVWEYQIERTIQAFVDGVGGPLMFQGQWVYPTGASGDIDPESIRPLQEGEKE